MPEILRAARVPNQDIYWKIWVGILRVQIRSVNEYHNYFISSPSMDAKPIEWKPVTAEYLQSLEKELAETHLNITIKYKSPKGDHYSLLIQEKKNPKPKTQKRDHELKHWAQSPKMKQNYHHNYGRKSNDDIEIFSEISDQNNLSFPSHRHPENNSEAPSFHLKPVFQHKAQREKAPKNFIKNIINCYTRFMFYNATERIVLEMVAAIEANKRMPVDSIQVSNNYKIASKSFQHKEIGEFFKTINAHQANKVKINYNKESVKTFCTDHICKCTLQYWLTYLADYCLDNYSSITELYKSSHRLAAKIILQHVANNTYQQLTFRSAQYKSAEDELPPQKPLELKEVFPYSKSRQQTKQIRQQIDNPKFSEYIIQSHEHLMDGGILLPLEMEPFY